MNKRIRKKKLKENLDKLLVSTGLGADFLDKKEKAGFIKFVQDMGETLPPRRFHTEHRPYLNVFSGAWEKVEMKLTTIGENDGT